MIEFRDVTKAYQNNVVIEGLNLTIAQGKITVIIGPSGSGKSTTLKMVNRLEEHQQGDIYFLGENITDYPPQVLRRRMGYAIQSNGLFPHWNVAKNIATVPQLLGWSQQKITTRVDELLTLLQLDPNDYRHRMPHELSGGQQQRVGVARALAADPEILLMDEPFGALDPMTRSTMQEQLKSIQRQLNKTILLITHDIDEALCLADHLIVMDQGKIVQQGTPHDILRRPNSEFVTHFIGQTDIGVKMLALEKVRNYLHPSSQINGRPTIAIHCDLRQALAVLVANQCRVINVVDDQQRVVGEIALEQLIALSDEEIQSEL